MSIHLEDRGEGTFLLFVTGAEEVWGGEALVLLATRSQQRALCLPQPELPSLTDEHDLTKAVSLHPFLLYLLLDPLASPGKVNTGAWSSPGGCRRGLPELKSLDIFLCPVCK